MITVYLLNEMFPPNGHYKMWTIDYNLFSPSQLDHNRDPNKEN